MTKRIWPLIMILALLIAACDGGGDPTPTPEPEPDTTPTSLPAPSEPTQAPATPTDAPAPVDDGYPGAPAPVPVDPGYPVPEAPPTIDPYPASIEGPVWVLYPAGEKCAKPEDTIYPTLQTAMADMTEIGVPVLGGEIINLNTCNSCGCPTEEHYRVQIDGESLAAVLNLGWTVEE